MSEHDTDTAEVVIDRRVYDLYDAYCYRHIDRGGFLRRCGLITVAGVSGHVMAQAMLPRLARTIRGPEHRAIVIALTGTALHPPQCSGHRLGPRRWLGVLVGVEGLKLGKEKRASVPR